MNILNETTFIIFSGVALLLLNILYGFVRAARGQVRAGWLTVGLALSACTLILIGSVGATVAQASSPTAGSAGAGGTAAIPGANGGGPRSGGNGGNGGSGSGGFNRTRTPRNRTPGAPNGPQATATPAAPSDATAGISTSADVANVPATVAPDAAGSAGTPTPAATRRFRGTPGPGTPSFNGGNGGAGGAGGGYSGGYNGSNGGNGGNGGNGAGTGGNGGFSGRNGTGNGSGNGSGNGGANGANLTTASAPTTAGDPLGLRIAVGGGVAGLLLAFVLYQVERRRKNFSAGGSRGLLNMGAAALILVAAFVIPIIPGQFAGASLIVAASDNAAAPTRPAPVIARSLPSATPTSGPQPTGTPTAPPTLTPTPTYPPIIAPTQIVVDAANAAAAATAATTSPAPGAGTRAPATNTPARAGTTCNVSVTNNLNLRDTPDPTGKLLLTIPAGTTLPVTGKTANKTWWQVDYNDGAKDNKGWVAAQYTVALSNCSSVPVIRNP